jgi:hypothetical protein
MARHVGVAHFGLWASYWSGKLLLILVNRLLLQ